MTKVGLMYLLNVLLTAATITGDNCGKPGQPVNGNYIEEKVTYSVDEEVNYTCDSENYHVIGNTIRKCLGNGTWSGSVPFCVISECGEPELPLKGVFYRINDTKGQLSCGEGYYLQGNSFIYCVNGRWDTNGQQCKNLRTVSENPSRCGVPGYPVNGQFYINNSAENEMIYKCDKGFLQFGPKKRTCQPNGTWSFTVPKCVKNAAMGATANHQRHSMSLGHSTDGDENTCETQDSDLLGYIGFNKKHLLDRIQIIFKKNYTKDIYIYATNSSVMDYTSLTPIGYMKIYSTFASWHIKVIKTTYLVIWLRDAASICEIIAFNSEELLDCDLLEQPDQPLHGRMVNRDGNRITFECDDGYEINGNESIRCVNGNWEDVLPVCSLIPTTLPPTTTTIQVELTTNETESHTNSSTPLPKYERAKIAIAETIIGVSVGVAVICLALIVVVFKVRNRKRNAQQSQLNQTFIECNSQSGHSNNVANAENISEKKENKESPKNFNKTSNVIKYDTNSAGTSNTELDYLPPIKTDLHDESITVENDLYESL